MTETSKCARAVTWAGGTHTFDLSHPWVWSVLSIRGLPGPNGATPVACLARFDSGAYSLDDVERVLELGLIGGGACRQDANKLLNDYVRGKPVLPNALLAMQVLSALFVGDAQVGAA
jgi:hypothetical protein